MFLDVMGIEILENVYAVYFSAEYGNGTVRPYYCKVVGFTPKKVRIKYLGIWTKKITTKLISSTETKLILVDELIRPMPMEKYDKTFELLE